jgi:hypothetical protein
VDIFISYARDERKRAALFKQQFERFGLSVFFDIEGGIDAGDAFPQRITDGLRAAKVVLACWSSHALARDWVRRECLMARDLKKLIPVCINPMLPSDMPAEFYDVSYEDLSNFTGQEKHWGWSQTLAAMARKLEGWAEDNPHDPDASRTLDLSNALRKASLASREAAPQATGGVVANPSAASGIWANIRESLEAKELRHFADSFPSTVESYNARQRAEKIEAAWDAVARAKRRADALSDETDERVGQMFGKNKYIRAAYWAAARDVRDWGAKIKEDHRGYIRTADVDTVLDGVVEYLERREKYYDGVVGLEKNMYIGLGIGAVVIVLLLATCSMQ